MKYSQDEYRFCKIVKSKHKLKKYTAVLVHRKTGKKAHVHFGGIRPNGLPYGQYFDSALGSYSKYNHEDKDRRRLWLLRHASDGFEPYSASYFARKYLWS